MCYVNCIIKLYSKKMCKILTAAEIISDIKSQKWICFVFLTVFSECLVLFGIVVMISYITDLFFNIVKIARLS